MDLTEAAVSYAKVGWKVFPLAAKSKMPAISRDKNGKGLHDATDDPARIEKWWVAHPNDNIGLSVGASGLYVVDIDGERGQESLADLVKEYGPLPETLCAITGKGFHLYYKHPEGMELGNTASKLGQGIDTRGFGGYCVLPPSVHPDGAIYEWKNQDIVPAPLPEWIIDKVKKITWIPPTFSPSNYSINVHPYVRRVVESTLADFQSAQHGNRNEALNIAAIKLGHWVGGGSLSRDRVEIELRSIARALGLGDNEVEKTLESGLTAGMAEPCYPPDPKQFQHENTVQQQARQSEGVISIQRGSSFGRKEIKYLWGNRVPIGKLTVLAGPSGVGKSYITLALGAHVTAGFKLLDDHGPGVDGEVLYCSYEDDVEDTIGPRADLLGLDMDRTHFITGVVTEHGERQFGPQDVPRIISFLKGAPDLKLIVIDPLGSFMGSGTDVNAENEARAVLQTLVKTAAECDCAVVMVAHYNKGSESSDPLHRIAGSQGISALPRSVLTVEWGEDKERLVRHPKASSSAQDATVGYRFDGKFEWTRVVREPDQVKDWLRQTLNAGPMDLEDVYSAGNMYGVTEKEIGDASLILNVKIEPTEYGYKWSLRP